MSVHKIAGMLAVLAFVPSLVWAQGAGGEKGAKARAGGGATKDEKAAKGKEGAAKAGDKAAAEEQAMMAAMEKAGAITENHRWLQKAVGSWTTETKVWMGPGEPQKTPGTSEVRAIMDGRFIVEDFKSTMMGRPFTGHGIEGYDNLKKKFVSVWLESTGTSIVTGEGTRDAKGVLTTEVSYIDPMTVKPAKMRIVARWEGNDKRVSEFFETHMGKEVKTMEMTYTRKPGTK